MYISTRSIKKYERIVVGQDPPVVCYQTSGKHVASTFKHCDFSNYKTLIKVCSPYSCQPMQSKTHYFPLLVEHFDNFLNFIFLCTKSSNYCVAPL